MKKEINKEGWNNIDNKLPSFYREGYIVMDQGRR